MSQQKLVFEVVQYLRAQGNLAPTRAQIRQTASQFIGMAQELEIDLGVEEPVVDNSQALLDGETVNNWLFTMDNDEFEVKRKLPFADQLVLASA